jgi:fumarate reductase iron-sulfur subunit
MKLTIQKTQEKIEYKVDQVITLLEALEQIKQTQDPSLAFGSGCRSGICGSCAVVVDGKEVLACTAKVQEGSVIEPLRNVKVIKDLVVDIEASLQKNKTASAALLTYKETTVTPEDEALYRVQSDCILCNSCYSACPVFSVNDAFLGPFTLTRVWRYVSNNREEATKEHIDAVQQNGIWDCTLCNECTLVCPQGISPKQDIEKLRAKSAQFGYMDPNFGSFGGGFGNDFGGGFDGSPVF